MEYNIYLVDAILIVVWIANYFMWSKYGTWLVSELYAHLDRMGVAINRKMTPMDHIARISIPVLNWVILALALLGVFGAYTISISAIWICINGTLMLLGIGFLLLCNWMEKTKDRREILRKAYLNLEDCYATREV